MTGLKTLSASGMILATLFLAQASAEGNKVFDMKLEGSVFTPAEIKVAAKQPFQIKFTNANPAPAELESIEAGMEKIAPANSSITVRVKGLEPGTYVFFDEFQQDKAKGTIIVE